MPMTASLLLELGSQHLQTDASRGAKGTAAVEHLWGCHLAALRLWITRCLTLCAGLQMQECDQHKGMKRSCC